MTTSTAVPPAPTGYTGWMATVKSQFPVAEEFEIAARLYSFLTAFEEGMSPEEAYADFDRWASRKLAPEEMAAAE
jgi:hypothetical protein